MSASTVLTEKQKEFFLRMAKAWQNYFPWEGLLPGISPSDEQRKIIELDEDHLIINGAAGSGKSITLMYKLLKLMKEKTERQRILYVTFNKTLLDDIKKRLESSEEYHLLKERHELDLYTFHYFAYVMLKKIGYQNVKQIDTSLEGIKRMEDFFVSKIEIIREEFMKSKEYLKLPIEQRLKEQHTAKFIYDEIMWMKANGIVTEEKYLEVKRTGRSQNPQLLREQRKTIFKIFQIYQERKEKLYHNIFDYEDYALKLLESIEKGIVPPKEKYDYIFVDEVQDLQPMQILCLVKMMKKGIVLTGDPKQRIYKSSPHSLSSLLGVNINNRNNRTLKQNFRSTKQIMALAESLKFDDVENDRLDYLQFVREGEKPKISYHKSEKELADELIRCIRRLQETDPESSIAIIHRYDEAWRRMEIPLQKYLSKHLDLISTKEYNRRYNHQAKRKPIFFTDVYSIKGLEFDHVFVIHFDRDHYPLKTRFEELNKLGLDRFSEQYQKDYNRLYNDEKKLLYVAMTRAKHTLRLMYHAKIPERISPFVRDFHIDDYEAIGFDRSKYRK